MSGTIYSPVQLCHRGVAWAVQFLLTVVDQSGNGGVVLCDLPSIPDGPPGKFLLKQMASVAELEGGIISQRTRAALQAAKRRGVRLGGDRGNLPTVCRAGAAASVLVRQRKAQERNADVLPRIMAMRKEGMSVSAIAERLNDDHIPAPRGGKWYPTSVQRILVRS